MYVYIVHNVGEIYCVCVYGVGKEWEGEHVV